MDTQETTSKASRSGGVFSTTRWTLVLASQGHSAQAQQALSDLCAAYYAPVVTFLRSEGRDEDAARELAHAFFAQVLNGHSFHGANPQRGRFRSYLLGALKHFLANQRARTLREKRGGQMAHQTGTAETDPLIDASIPDSSAATPDVLFDRQWAINLMERALETLKLECEQSGTLQEFQVLKPWLTGEGLRHTQFHAARELGISDGAVRVAVHRLRRRFRELVKSEVAHTLDDPAEVVQEIRHLLGAL